MSGLIAYATGRFQDPLSQRFSEAVFETAVELPSAFVLGTLWIPETAALDFR